MTLSILADQLVAANPGPAAHLALLGAVVVIGLVVLAITRWRKRHEEKTVDELGLRDLPTEHRTPDRQSRHPADHGGHPAEQERHAHRHS